MDVLDALGYVFLTGWILFYLALGAVGIMQSIQRRRTEHSDMIEQIKQALKERP